MNSLSQYTDEQLHAAYLAQIKPGHRVGKFDLPTTAMRIRIAAEFLNAQKRRKKPSFRFLPMKHIIEAWAGHFISQGDVEVAAKLVGLCGTYPLFNLSLKLVVPNPDLLAEIPCAYRQPNYCEYFSGRFFGKSQEANSRLVEEAAAAVTGDYLTWRASVGMPCFEQAVA